MEKLYVDYNASEEHTATIFRADSILYVDETAEVYEAVILIT
jgi:hypothetical protein